jgi:hypothetical protein
MERKKSKKLPAEQVIYASSPPAMVNRILSLSDFHQMTLDVQRAGYRVFVTTAVDDPDLVLEIFIEREREQGTSKIDLWTMERMLLFVFKNKPDELSQHVASNKDVMRLCWN